MATPHYGGTLSPSGRVGRKPAEGTQFKTEVLLERLVRFDLMKTQGVSVMSDDDIARVLNKSKRRIAVLRTGIPYLRKRMEVLTGINTDAQESVEISVTRHKQMVKLMLPDALRVIADAVRTPVTASTSLAEKKFKVEVARDILDREGSFPRISRTDSHLKVEHNFESVDLASKEIMEAMGQEPVQASKPTQSILDAIAINKEFAESETLALQDMEASLKDLETNGQIN